MERIATTIAIDPVVQAPQLNRGTWATVTTLKEDPSVVRDFIAQHLFLGASEIFLFFDDPSDPAYDMVKHLPQVRAFLCDDAHWGGADQRPDRHQARQKANAQRAYQMAACEWIIHLDADEMVSAPRMVADILAQSDQDVLCLPPFEMLSYEKAGENGRPTHYFRGSLPRNQRGRKIAAAVYHPYSEALEAGTLSHTAGKFFVRTGLDGMVLSIHGPFKHGKRVESVFADGLILLHFHGGDYTEWLSRMEYRLSKGVYVAHLGSESESNKETLYSTLMRLKETQGEEGLAKFYRVVCTYRPKMAMLKKVGALHRQNLWQSAKTAAVFGTQTLLSRPSLGPAGFEADLDWDGIALRVTPDSNYTECLLARGRTPEAEELAHMRSLVRGRRVLFYDIGANVGTYCLTIAKHGAPDSQILAYEPNPEMQRRLMRNVALNGFENITLRPVALSDQVGVARLSFWEHGNLGQASLVLERSESIDVPTSTLAAELQITDGFDLSVMKIDVEGAEALVLGSALRAGRALPWPDVIMLEHKSDKDWGLDLFKALAEQGYRPKMTTTNNTFLYRERD